MKQRSKSVFAPGHGWRVGSQAAGAELDSPPGVWGCMQAAEAAKHKVALANQSLKEGGVHDKVQQTTQVSGPAVWRLLVWGVWVGVARLGWPGAQGQHGLQRLSSRLRTLPLKLRAELRLLPQSQAAGLPGCSQTALSWLPPQCVGGEREDQGVRQQELELPQVGLRGGCAEGGGDGGGQRLPRGPGGAAGE